MTRTYKRMSTFSTNHVPSTYLQDVGCSSSNQTRNTWFGPRHVWCPLRALVRLLTSPKAVLNSDGTSNTSRQYSSQIRLKPSKRWMSNTYTRFSPLRESLVSRPHLSQRGRMSSAKPQILWFGANCVCSLHSAQFTCKSFVIIRILSPVERHVFRQFSILIVCE
jgi:hypothetical protein